MAPLPTEDTPLLGPSDAAPLEISSAPASAKRSDVLARLQGADHGSLPLRTRVYLVLEGLHRPPDAANSAAKFVGTYYESYIVFLILASVVAFVVGSLFDDEYNGDAPYAHMCGKTCDMLFFGNYSDNGLGFLFMGTRDTTSILELVTILTFTVDYMLRLWTADIESDKYKGFVGRLKYIPSFYSLVDLGSTVPFWVDVFTPEKSVEATQFLRMFRFFRMLRMEGRYGLALDLYADVFTEQSDVMGTALFIGVTTWITVASLYYVAERRNNDMIYCPDPANTCEEGIESMDDVDVDKCVVDSWGVYDCTEAGCPPTEENPEPCYNLFRSIVSSGYYALLNLFGEFPLCDQHSPAGKVVGTLTAVVAVAVFALPTGLIGNSIEDLMQRRKEAEEAAEGEENGEEAEVGEEAHTISADASTSRGRLYNFLQHQVGNGAVAFDWIVYGLIVVASLSFIVGTSVVSDANPNAEIMFNNLDVVIVLLFTVEYVVRLYAGPEHPKGFAGHLSSYDFIVDSLAVLPFWIHFAITQEFVPVDYFSVGAVSVRVLRLFRVLRFERLTHAFRSFDDVLRSSSDVLLIAGFAALMMWIFFSAALHVTERDNPDGEMADYYRTVPHAMWVTLLNLSGEAPLDKYTTWGKILTGVIGIFATALFGIPIGILGAGFEELVEERIEEAEAEENGEGGEGDVENGDAQTDPLLVGGSAPALESAPQFEKALYDITEGVGSSFAKWFEVAIYVLIFITVAIGIIQTVEGHEDDFSFMEWFAVIVFTVEYIMRFIGAGADPAFAHISNPLLKRLRFLVSFYSLVDLAAIVPFYAAEALPGSWADRHDEFLRMLRLFRLLKLDKYVPSISLIDDVFRLKKDMLIVTGFAAGTLWVIFSSLLYVGEYHDTENGIDPVPVYGCDDDCTMSDRFRSYVDSLVYTCIHLTGDYPIIEYSSWSRVFNFFMVIAAVGLVSIPSGLVANGFTELVQTTNRHKKGEEIPTGGNAGDDWYEVKLRELEGEPAPPSKLGPAVDGWQIEVNEFLNGEVNPRTGETTHTCQSTSFRIFMLTLIVLNVLAVLLETVPEIDRAVGNQAGNAFDVFEDVSIFFFTLEYALRLFSARKSLEALYSPWVYATTFYGIVDFLSTAPWYVERILLASGFQESADASTIFRIFRIFRLLQLEDFLVAFRKLDNVFRASKDVLKATGLMAVIIWVGCGALFFLFEGSNPNFRECDDSVPLRGEYDDNGTWVPGCYDFETTRDCNESYPGMCEQTSFVNMPDSLYYTAVFLGGEWGLVDFTWGGRFVCMFLCLIGIALYAIPVGSLFDSFGAVIGLAEDEDEEEEEEGEENEEGGE